MVVSRSCSGLISPRPLKRMTVGLRPHASRPQTVENPLPLGLVERVVHVLAGVDAEQRRHGHMDVAIARTSGGNA
jgi:hypothetical protein